MGCVCRPSNFKTKGTSKKLIQVGYLVQQKQSTGVDPDDLEMFEGVEELEKLRSDNQPQFEVWYSNWESYEAFIHVQTQWNIVIPPAGGKPLYLGLKYDGVLAYLQATNKQHLFEDIQYLERGSLLAFNDEPFPDWDTTL